MNERRKQDAYKHLAAIRQSLDALGKLGLAGTDDLFERKLRRIVGRAHEAMRELGEFLEEAHPHGAPRPAAPPGADLSARLLSSADLAAYRALQRQSLDALGKLGLAGTDDLFERKLRRIVGRAHEAMRELGEFLEEAHPHGAPRPAAPPGADLSARLLSSADLAAYRALQRQSLEEAPLAFVQTLDEDARTPDEEVAAWLDRGEVWGVFRRGELVGKLVLEALPHAPFAHTRWLHAVYIHPGARGSGAGEALIAAVSAHARARGVTRLLLWVHSENPPARAFYEKVGFRETGLIPGGIRLRDHCADDILMWARLD